MDTENDTNPGSDVTKETNENDEIIPSEEGEPSNNDNNPIKSEIVVDVNIMKNEPSYGDEKTTSVNVELKVDDTHSSMTTEKKKKCVDIARRIKNKWRERNCGRNRNRNRNYNDNDNYNK